MRDMEATVALCSDGRKGCERNWRTPALTALRPLWGGRPTGPVAADADGDSDVRLRPLPGSTACYRRGRPWRASIVDAVALCAAKTQVLAPERAWRAE